jgi:hypothetical protein
MRPVAHTIVELPITPTMPPTQYNTTKWGKVAILNGDNYPEFQDTCTAVLAVVDAWSIIEGEHQPQNQRAADDWKTRNQRAIQIISGSVEPRFLSKISPFVRAKDVPGIWAELAKFNRTNDPVFNSSLREGFSAESFDPLKETIRDFSTRLFNYKTQLDGSEFALTERDVTLRLLAALPIESHWQQAKHFAIRERQDLEGTITLLQSYEKQLPAQTPDTTPKDSALVLRRNNERNTSKRRRSRSRESESRTRCYFCDKNGHVQSNCLQYLKARDKIRRRIKRRKEETSDSESESQSDDKRSKDKRKGKKKGKDAQAGMAMSLYGRDDVVDL